MRGKGPNTPVLNCPNGITPAYAGKSGIAVSGSDVGWDHPRVCGEKTDAQYQLPIMQGSPPRMRGKGRPCFILKESEGITPAYAGKSDDTRNNGGNNRDHPRVCGEKLARGSVS